MFHQLIVIVLLIEGISSIPTDQLSQSRSAVAEFRDMITQVTGRSALDYLGYGCYCGLGGKGKPIDELDRCCQIHDQCYAKTSTYLQFWNLCSPHLIAYSWNFDDGMVTCTGNTDTCRYKTCVCDKMAAECFARNAYNIKHKGYSQSLCL